MTIFIHPEPLVIIPAIYMAQMAIVAIIRRAVNRPSNALQV
jgi:hypothetical protein